MEMRPPKETDQYNMEKAFYLLKKFMQDHSEIEPTLWSGAFWSILVHGYANSGFSYDKFSEEWDRIKVYYKHWFEGSTNER